MNVEFAGLSELRETLRALDEKHKQAVSSTLNALAFEVRKSTQEKLGSGEWVKTTRPFLKNSIFYKKATPANLVAAVGVAPHAQPVISLLEMGGTRTPKRRALAVPVEAKRTAKGGISTANRPAKVLARNDTFSGEINGLGGVWRKLKRGGLSLLYAWKARTEYRVKRTRFYENGRDVVERLVVSKYREAMERLFGG